MPYPIVHPTYEHEGRTYRLVQGWCFDCAKGAILCQTPGLTGKWIIHKYMFYDMLGNLPLPTNPKSWQELTPLPPLEAVQKPREEPILKIGQGDYCREIREEELDAALRGTLGALVDLAEKTQVVLNAVKSIVTLRLKKTNHGLDD